MKLRKLTVVNFTQKRGLMLFRVPTMEDKETPIRRENFVFLMCNGEEALICLSN